MRPLTQHIDKLDKMTWITSNLVSLNELKCSSAYSSLDHSSFLKLPYCTLLYSLILHTKRLLLGIVNPASTELSLS